MKLQRQIAVGRPPASNERSSPSPPLPPLPLHVASPGPSPLDDSRSPNQSRDDEDEDSESALGAVGGATAAGAYYYPPPSPIRESDFPFLADNRPSHMRNLMQRTPQSPVSSFGAQQPREYVNVYQQQLPSVNDPESRRKPMVLFNDEDLGEFGAHGGSFPASGNEAAHNTGRVEVNANEYDPDDDERYVTGQ